MTVVSNTSPVSNLAMIGRLSLFQSQFDHVLIPKTVDQELAQLADASASEGLSSLPSTRLPIQRCAGSGVSPRRELAPR